MLLLTAAGAASRSSRTAATAAARQVPEQGSPRSNSMAQVLPKPLASSVLQVRQAVLLLLLLLYDIDLCASTHTHRVYVMWQQMLYAAVAVYSRWL